MSKFLLPLLVFSSFTFAELERVTRQTEIPAGELNLWLTSMTLSEDPEIIDYVRRWLNDFGPRTEFDKDVISHLRIFVDHFQDSKPNERALSEMTTGELEAALFDAIYSTRRRFLGRYRPMLLDEVSRIEIEDRAELTKYIHKIRALKR